MQKPYKPIIIIDTRLVLYQLYHQRRPLTDLWQYLYSHLKNFYPYKKLVFAYDSPKGSLKRKSLFKDYKAQRKEKQKKMTKVEQDRLKEFNELYGRIKPYLSLFGTVIELDGIEADDIAAFLVERFEGREQDIILASSDVDWGYLLKYPNTYQYHFHRNVLIDRYNLSEYSDYREPYHILEYQVLAGSPKENVPGIKGLGIKRFYKAIDLSPNGDEIECIKEWLEEGKFGLRLPDNITDVDELFTRNMAILQPMLLDELDTDQFENLRSQFEKGGEKISQEERWVVEMELFGGLAYLDDDISKFFKIFDKF